VVMRHIRVMLGLVSASKSDAKLGTLRSMGVFEAGRRGESPETRGQYQDPGRPPSASAGRTHGGKNATVHHIATPSWS
jgi:hypothetical protein